MKYSNKYEKIILSEGYSLVNDGLEQSDWFVYKKNTKKNNLEITVHLKDGIYLYANNFRTYNPTYTTRYLKDITPKELSFLIKILNKNA